MISFLNSLSHIANYAGVGMIMVAAGIILTAIAIIMLSKQRKADRRQVAEEFNQRFVRDTGLRIADVEEGARRREIARKIGIKENY